MLGIKDAVLGIFPKEKVPVGRRSGTLGKVTLWVRIHGVYVYGNYPLTVFLRSVCQTFARKRLGALEPKSMDLEEGRLAIKVATKNGVQWLEISLWRSGVSHPLVCHLDDLDVAQLEQGLGKMLQFYRVEDFIVSEW